MDPIAEVGISGHLFTVLLNYCMLLFFFLMAATALHLHGPPGMECKVQGLPGMYLLVDLIRDFSENVLAVGLLGRPTELEIIN
jgi:hypothetical protein